jgi:hypothetical protein
MIFSALDALIGGVQVLFKHPKKWSPPLWSGLFWVLNYYSCNSIITNEMIQLQEKNQKIKQGGSLFSNVTKDFACV